MTVNDLIKESMLLISAIAPGETPTAAESANGLSSINRMLGSWSTNRLFIYERKRESFALTPSQQSYTFGVGGDFDSARPMNIIKACIEIGGYEYGPMRMLTTEEWAGVTIKSTSSDLPEYFYKRGTYPLETLDIWSVPSQAMNLVIYSEKPLTAFSSISDTVELPSGYDDALIYNLAIRLAPSYEKVIDPEISRMAREFIANIKRQNIKPQYMTSDAATLINRKRYNIYTGEAQ